MNTKLENESFLARLGALEAPWALRREPDGTHLAFLDFEEVLELNADSPSDSLEKLLAPRSPSDLSFSGWVGFFSYEFLAGLAGLQCQAKRDLDLPGGWFGRPRSVLRVTPDGIEVESYSPQRTAALESILNEETKGSGHDAAAQRDSPRCNLDFESYRQIFLQAREEILDGNVYQIKISQRFEVEGGVEPITAYTQLETINPSPESFVLCGEDFSIVSCSPETVLIKKGDHLVTRPIGGTWDREADESFLDNVKERREHNMLVDLERNDLSTVCLPGSVKIMRFREVETYSHLHHLTSTIEGRLRPGVEVPEILRAMLPGGTITGCPKYRAMELIDSLEPCFRGPYTGSFGTIEDNGDLRLNLIIRAIVTAGERSFAQTGGGIVVDSTPEYERKENQIKAQALLDALQ